MSKDWHDVTKDILTEDHLEKLRKAYDKYTGPDNKLQSGYDFMKAATGGAVKKCYPASAGWVAQVIESQYSGKPIAPKDRERTLIALLASKADGPFMCIHVYWGLMEGLSLEEVAHTLFLTGCYCGMDAFMHGLIALDTAYTAMKKVAEAPEPNPKAVFDELLVAFGIAKPEEAARKQG
jgi:alkylhydroperoxidase/carboxymuconolactone decarboxylase family protein YurZ